MISKDYLVLMANYNKWQNKSIYRAANTLSEEERRAPRGVFFGSLHATLNHVLWADQLWMHRFADTPEPLAKDIPSSIDQYDWENLQVNRQAFDEVIFNWATNLDPSWLVGDLSWFSGAANRDITRPKDLLAAHFFNHQTHHRGQAHAMLTSLACTLDDTDIPFMPTLDI